jgi:hypothetical protein
VLAHCRAHLEDFMVPKSLEFRDSLPKNASGKIDKLALAERRLPARREGVAALKHAVPEAGAPLAATFQFETQTKLGI